MNKSICLTRRESFSASHHLHSEHLTPIQNKKIFDKCNNPNGHGHNYELFVTVKGLPDPITGLIMNLTDLKKIIKKNILLPFDHKHLNLDTPHFKSLNPTVENIVIVIWTILDPLIPKLHEVKVIETENNSAYYRREST